MLTFIPITEVDEIISEEVRQWRNAQEIRSQMVNSHVISLEEHTGWVASLKENKTTRVWVAYHDGIPFGVVNLAKIDYQQKTTDWGIYIGDLDHRGRGLARPLLYSLMNHVFEVLGLNKMQTKVLEDNEAAQTLYKKMGFAEVPGSEVIIKRADDEACFIEMAIEKKDWLSLELNLKPEALL